MTKLGDRPTPDLVVMALVAIVAVLLVGSMVAVVILEATNHEADLPALAGKLADVTNTLIGAIVGYVAGRGRQAEDGDQ
jgi:hypothetical protein